MAYSREQLEDAIAKVIGHIYRYNSYELDGDSLTANFKSNSKKMDRQVFIDFDEQDGEYTGDMTISQSEYYPGDSAGWGLARSIKECLHNPDMYGDYEYEDKRIYPNEDNDEEEYPSGNGGLIIAGLAVVAAIGYGLFKGGQFIFKNVREKINQKNQESKDTLENVEVEMIEKDSTVEVMQMASQVAKILNDLPENASLEQFKEAFDKAREIDLRSPYFYIRERKDRFTPEMIEYAQGFYDKEI